MNTLAPNHDAALDMLRATLSPEMGGNAAPHAPAPEPAQPQDDDASVIEKPAPNPPPEVKAPESLKKGAAALDIEPDEEEEKPAEEEKDDTPEDAKTPEAKNAWSKIKAEAKELREAKAALEAEKTRLAAELETKKGLEANDPLKTEYERMKAEREEWQKEAALYKIEQTDAYKAAVTIPMDRIGAAAADLAKRNEISEDDVFTALRETDIAKQNEKLATIADGLNERDKIKLYRLADELAVVYSKSAELQSNASEALKEAKAFEAEELGKKQLAARAAEMRSVENLREKLHKAAPLFKFGDENEADAINKVLSEANAVPFDEQDTDTKAFSHVAAAILPRLLRNTHAQRKEIAALKKEIAGYSKGGPGTSDGSRTAPSTNPDAITGFDSVMANIARDLAALGR